MSTDFKPNFNNPDPWAGVPADYAGVATFIPTESNPEPPWQDEVGGEVIPAYGTPQYALVAQGIIWDAYATAEDTSGVEHEKAIELLTWAKNAADAGAGTASAPIGLPPVVVPPSTKAPASETNWMIWAGLGLLAMMVISPGKK